MRGPTTRFVVAGALALAACVDGAALDDASLALQGTARGSFSCDFDLPATMDASQVPPIIERDRMYMAARPGHQRKHIPLSPPVADQPMRTGGRYLFDSRGEADAYRDWVMAGFMLDGVRFLDRAYVLNEVCGSWTVIGTEDFRDVHDGHDLIRTQRFVATSERSTTQLRALWSTLREAARDAGMSSATLSYRAGARLVEVVLVAPGDVHSIVTLGSSSVADGVLVGDGQAETFDRTQFVLTTWFPFVAGDAGEPSLWPNSPPFPAPWCGDGVCEVSRGEDGEACDADCPPRCGDAVCQPADGEDTHTCPGDCRLGTP